MNVNIFLLNFLIIILYFEKQIELERTPEDREIDAIADYVLRLEMQISRVRNLLHEILLNNY